MLQKKKRLALAGAFIVMFCALGAPLKAFASGGVELLPQTVSLDVRNADVRDVLSAVAVGMGKSIVYKGGEQRVTVKLSDMPSMTAFDYILRLAGMTYIQDGSTLIVSTREVLTEDFARRLALTSFRLQYISGAVLTQKIQQLNLPVTVLSMEENVNTLWIQGFPADIAKVRELINVLDIPENESGTGDATLSAKTLSYVKLKYIAPEDFNLFLRTLGIEYGFAASDAGDRLYLFANAEERKVVNDLKAKLDRENPDFRMDDLSSFSVITVNNISKETAVSAISAIYPALQVISVDNSAKSFFVSGKSEDISRAAKLVSDLDKVNNANISQTFFAYNLANISAAEAQRRLEGISFADTVAVYVSTYSEFAKTIFIYCNSDYEEQLRELIERIDTTPVLAYNMPIYTGEATELALYESYLTTMLTGVSLDFGTFSLGGSKQLLYLIAPNANTVTLVEEMLGRLSQIASGDAAVGDLSWSAYETAMGGTPIAKTAENVQAYGYWVLGRTGAAGKMGFSAGITGFSASIDGAEGSLAIPEKSGQDYLQETATEIDTFLATVFIAGEETSMQDVVTALQAEFSPGITFRNARLFSHILPKEDSAGSLEFTVVIEAPDGAWREHRILLTLPQKYAG